VTITDDEIDGFLFRVNEDVRNKVMVLGGEPVEQLPVPILFGIPIGGFTDTWGETQTGGRVHAGIDIMADRGALVVSPTDAVVTKIGYDNRGGNFVVTANPGGEQFYFAHLDRAAENLSVGDVLTRGDLIGYVGNTGNARSTAPHLHLGIYYKGIARNPFQRLIREFSIEERLASVEHILTENKIILGEHNGGVRFLQRFLIQNGTGPRATALAKIGATGYFGPFTKNALVEYQKTASIVPASGYFGLVTRTHIVTKLLVNINAEDKTGASNKLQLFDL
ncbi:MAG: peptidoglycan DD-metalloendopeptidase family protein, partial [Patescibacteria group bacterium]|nr:peptidoglycan DD-metalloendopeptidase family protein [Patescibacteria group bacterium]